jgi:competence protein ComEA
VDINIGSADELDSLPGIGPSLAKAIMVARPFSRPEDIERVKGISPAMAGRLLPLIHAAHGQRDNGPLRVGGCCSGGY